MATVLSQASSFPAGAGMVDSTAMPLVSTNNLYGRLIQSTRTFDVREAVGGQSFVALVPADPVDLRVRQDEPARLVPRAGRLGRGLDGIVDRLRGGFALKVNQVHPAVLRQCETEEHVRQMLEESKDRFVKDILYLQEFQSCPFAVPMVPVYVLGENSQRLGYLMPELKSADDVPPSKSMALQVLRQLISILCFFRKSQVVYCDFKPENILLRELPGGGFEVKLNDFGFVGPVGGEFQGGTEEYRYTLYRKTALPRYPPLHYVLDTFAVLVTFVDLYGSLEALVSDLVCSPSRMDGFSRLGIETKFEEPDGTAMLKEVFRPPEENLPSDMQSLLETASYRVLTVDQHVDFPEIRMGKDVTAIPFAQELVTTNEARAFADLLHAHMNLLFSQFQDQDAAGRDDAGAMPLASAQDTDDNLMQHSVTEDMLNGREGEPWAPLLPFDPDSGGFGQVWRYSGGTVVKCRRRREAQPEERFKKELDDLQKHQTCPYIVPILPVSFSGEKNSQRSRLGYLMEVLEPADQFLGNKSVALQVAKQLVPMLRLFKEHELVFGNLKPENFLVQQLPGGRFKVKLHDVGFAGTAGGEFQGGAVEYLHPEYLSVERAGVCRPKYPPLDYKLDAYAALRIYREVLSPPQ